MTGRPATAAPVVLNGRYALGDLIAEGGMAHVFRGHDLLLDRPVAIKILRAQYAASPEFLDRFRREARLAASLPHVHLVAVYDVGQDGERHFIVMELLPGRTLKDLVNGRPLPLQEAESLAMQVASGMAFAHRRGLVHRDLKPQNVLIADDGSAKVADFGLAQAGETTQLTMPGTVWGTVQYISPEQAQGLRPDARSDVYALGVILYELLTGKPPFEADTPAAIMMKHVYDPPPSVRDANPALPVAAEEVVQRALAKSPDDRFRSMEEFAQALAALRDAAGAETMVWSPAPRPAGRAAARRDPPLDQTHVMPAPPVRTASDRTHVIPAARGAPATPRRRPVDPRVPRAQPAPPGRAGRPTTVPPRRRSRAPVVVAGVVLAFFALLALGALLARQVFGPRGATALPAATPRPASTATATAVRPTPVPTVTVPAVVGLAAAAAQESLRAAGLVPEPAEDFNKDVPAGHVAGQEPAANTTLEKGKPVKLTVSKGPQMVAVPTLIGQPAREAADELAKRGFAVDRQEAYNNEAPRGIVFGQEPRGGEAPAGSSVVLRVSLGREQVTVPRVRGRTEQDAIKLLSDAGLVAQVSHEPTSVVEPGVVFSEDPPEGSQVDKGGVVRLRVRRDPTPVPATATVPAPTATPRPAATATATPGRTPPAQANGAAGTGGGSAPTPAAGASPSPAAGATPATATPGGGR